jgi:MFS transporter, DHA1 family, multidrug resistance protein
MNSSTVSKIHPTEFIILSAASMALTALGIDIMLPAFGELRSHFGLGSESTATAQIISFFFMGQIAQIIFGPLSDRFGRLAILRIGFPLYIVGGLAAAYAPTLALMLAARFVAGMGASAVFTATIAGVRDRFVGDQMARIMSFILTIFLFTPVIAPFLGIGILAISSWKIVFLTPPMFAAIVFLWSLRLDESLPPTSRRHITGTYMVNEVRRVLSNRIFLRYVAITTILFTAFSAYIASSERIVSEIYGQPKLFPWIFAGIGVVMSMFTLLNSHLSTRFGAAPTLRRLLIAYVAIAGVLLIATLFLGDPPVMVFFFIAIAFLTGINVAIEPNSSALALEPMGSTAGLAAAIYGTSFFFVGAGLGTLISNNLVTGVLPLVESFFAIGVITLALAYTDRR